MPCASNGAAGSISNSADSRLTLGLPFINLTATATKSQKASLIFQLKLQKIVFELKPLVPCHVGVKFVKAQHRNGACDRHRLEMLQTGPKVSHRCHSPGFEPFPQDNAFLDHGVNLIAGANRPHLKHQFPCKKIDASGSEFTLLLSLQTSHLKVLETLLAKLYAMNKLPCLLKYVS